MEEIFCFFLFLLFFFVLVERGDDLDPICLSYHSHLLHVNFKINGFYSRQFGEDDEGIPMRQSRGDRVNCRVARDIVNKSKTKGGLGIWNLTL